ncbi:MAG: cystathionine gamma-synthase [Actinobacteria bacterium RBG_13_63_9]|nr:MAG: cystathionine gamma-synthase [Actinobacteria bacterium RBG_13_63_9]
MSTKRKRRAKELSIYTRAVHSGEREVKYSHAITVPISQTSTFVFPSTEEIKRYTSGKLARYEYGRYGTPTQKAAEGKLADLEGAEDCLIFDSGMAAIASTLLALLKKGDHVVLTDDVYGQTLKFCTQHLPRFGIDSTVTKMGDYQALEAAIRKNTRIVFSESPTNPYLNVIDLKRMQEIRRGYGGLMIIDATFATPYNQRPLEWGMDLVIHSATKYLAGHNDILAGALLGSHELVDRVREYQRIVGSVISPLCSYLLIRGMKTFALRVAYQNQSAQKVAEFLEGHPRVRKVFYPGLPSHPHHQIAKAQMKGFGGVVSFWTKGSLKQVNRFLDALQSIYIGPTLGGTETLITHPATVTYYRNTRKERYQLGITDQLCRLALGIEDPDDIIGDLDQALGKMDG